MKKTVKDSNVYVEFGKHKGQPVHSGVISYDDHLEAMRHHSKEYRENPGEDDLRKHHFAMHQAHAAQAQRLTFGFNEEREEMNLDESHMKELYSSLMHHTDKHIDKFIKLGGADQLGSRLHAAGKKIAKEHGIPEKDAHEHVNNYLTHRLDKAGIKEDHNPGIIKFKDFVLEAKEEHPDEVEDKKLVKKMVKKDCLVDEEVQIDETSPFDWKNKPSEIDWSNHKNWKRTETGVVHKARETARNPEGGSVEKKSVGRPKGSYGSYKIDKAKRDDPEYKAQLSAKVRAAKKDGLEARKEFKDSMHAAIKKRQLELAGLKEGKSTPKHSESRTVDVHTVTSVPEWAKGKLQIGQLVYRHGPQDVEDNGAHYKLGEKHTKFSHKTTFN